MTNYRTVKCWPGRKRLKTCEIYEQSSINEVIKKTSLYNVISDYIALKKSGKDYVGRCPFCRQLTRNDTHFRVSDRLHRFKCFECGIGGTNAIGFIMRYHNKPFDEAISYVNRFYHRDKINLIIKRIREDKSRTNKDDLPF
jgi:DNA primase